MFIFIYIHIYSETSQERTATGLKKFVRFRPLLGGNFKKTGTFRTKRFIRYSWCIRYLGCPLLGGLTVYISCA